MDFSTFNYIERFDFPYCSDAAKYEKVAKIGQGAYGEVFKAREKYSNNKFVAMKRVPMEREKQGVSTKYCPILNAVNLF